MNEMLNRMPRWLLLLLGLALLGLAIQALFSGVVQTPSSHAFLRQDLARAEQPLTYWGLLLTYLGLGAALLYVAARRYRQREDTWQPAPPVPRPRGILRALAWLGVLAGVLLTSAGVAAHVLLDAIISLPFVALFCGGGLTIGLASAGYLATGRLQ